MSLTFKFEEEGYLPGFAHLLVQSLRDNPAAEVIGVEDAPKGALREVVFGLDGEKSTDDRLLLTDVEVMLAARDYCKDHAQDYSREMGKHLRTTAFMIDQHPVPRVANPEGQSGQGSYTAEA